MIETISKVGFTGTRDGLTKKQKESLTILLSNIKGESISHGDCTGADKDCHKIATELGYITIIHPPTAPIFRAYCKGNVVHEPKSYLPRNKDIVDTTEILVACPKSMFRAKAGGTWYTIRYAETLGRMIYLVLPDGAVNVISRVDI